MPIALCSFIAQARIPWQWLIRPCASGCCLVRQVETVCRLRSGMPDVLRNCGGASRTFQNTIRGCRIALVCAHLFAVALTLGLLLPSTFAAPQNQRFKSSVDVV